MDGSSSSDQNAQSSKDKNAESNSKLANKSSPTVSHQFYESICRVREINSYDWCTAVSECLHLGLMNFQTNARKGNTSGKAALGGCLFLLAAVYFDYLVLDSAFLEPTLPRIRVWDDNAICSYSGAELGIQNIEFKPMEETLFNKHQPLRQFVDLTSLVGISLPSSQHPTLPAMLPTINPSFARGKSVITMSFMWRNYSSRC